jgi:hypothetical protein
LRNTASARGPLDGRGASTFLSYLDTKRAGFADPWDVVLDPNLTSIEKKEILADWASDAHAVEGRPDLRMNEAGAVLALDRILECLRLVDAEVAAATAPRAVNRVLRPPRPLARLGRYRTA